MGWNRAQLKQWAKAQLGRQYFSYLLASFLLILLGGGAGGITSSWNVQNNSGLNGEMSWMLSGILATVLAVSLLISLGISIFVAGPLEVGVRRFYLAGTKGIASMNLIGSGFRKEEYMSQVSIIFIKNLFLVLWSLLLVIPGIVKAYEYRFVSYIAAERPGIGYKEAIAISRRMTMGHKWNMFVLDLSFLGWMLLGSLCCGIGIIFVQPYVDATFTQLYETLKIPEVTGTVQ